MAGYPAYSHTSVVEQVEGWKEKRGPMPIIVSRIRALFTASSDETEILSYVGSCRLACWLQELIPGYFCSFGGQH